MRRRHRPRLHDAAPTDADHGHASGEAPRLDPAASFRSDARRNPQAALRSVWARTYQSPLIGTAHRGERSYEGTTGELIQRLLSVNLMGSHHTTSRVLADAQRQGDLKDFRRAC